ncbi:hypothetical protein PIB30_024130 [Stylosanthes scabra]|uniref:Uncharacterized protein n=1 Tax=Stylosanthes scabra TaxID=79078 RepID=A0ABU6W968_9FABA|nr:hypothetical protein [Stylosanthes scabra]
MSLPLLPSSSSVPPPLDLQPSRCVRCSPTTSSSATSLTAIFMQIAWFRSGGAFVSSDNDRSKALEGNCQVQERRFHLPLPLSRLLRRELPPRVRANLGLWIGVHMGRAGPGLARPGPGPNSARV